MVFCHCLNKPNPIFARETKQQTTQQHGAKPRNTTLATPPRTQNLRNQQTGTSDKTARPRASQMVSCSAVPGLGAVAAGEGRPPGPHGHRGADRRALRGGRWGGGDVGRCWEMLGGGGWGDEAFQLQRRSAESSAASFRVALAHRCHGTSWTSNLKACACERCRARRGRAPRRTLLQRSGDEGWESNVTEAIHSEWCCFVSAMVRFSINTCCLFCSVLLDSFLRWFVEVVPGRPRPRQRGPGLSKHQGWLS